jgi:hypothetical protein
MVLDNRFEREGSTQYQGDLPGASLRKPAALKVESIKFLQREVRCTYGR